MNKLILPINAYIVNSNGSIVDAFSGTPSYGNENGADVYHVYNADLNAYYNVLMTEELKAVIANTFNMPYAAGSYTGGVRVLTVGSDPTAFEWTPITSLVASPRIQGIYLNDKYLTPGRHGYSSVDGHGHTQSVLVYAKEPNFLYVTAPSGSAAYIALKREGKGNGFIHYTEDPYSNNWSSLGYDTSLNVAGKKYYLSGDINPYVGTNASNYTYLVTSGANTISFYGDITYLVGNTGSSNYNEPAYKGGDKTLKDFHFYKFFYNCTQIIKAPDLPSTTIGSYCYSNMFRGCTSLVNAPELPATTIGTYCYDCMFYGCTSLTKALELPATALTVRCYENMFSYCTSLVNAPELPATTLAEYCYYYMFSYCTSLVNAPELPATTLVNACYNSMFYRCTSLTKTPELPATALASNCYAGMFQYCTNLTKAPELPATTLVSGCYYNMFNGCTSLTKAPELPATTLVSSCYYNMFNGCTKLNYVKALFISTPLLSYTNNWLSNVASTGTFVKSKNATWTSVSDSAVPIGWTVSVYKTAQLHTDELPESYMEDTGKVLMVDASGLWVKKELNTDSMTNVTYSDIKTLRDTSALTPGMLYRITDYECTTSAADTSAAGHAFDIVIVADSSDTLNENARAIQNADDDYFDNANLQAWELKYTIDNDDIYAWATPDGKGVVYYMEDEYGNVCGYDFKNIKFAFADTSSALVDSSDHYYYTFTDASTDGDLSMKKDSSTVCEKNRIMALNDDVSFILPFTVFIAGNSVYNNTILDASGNIFCEAHDNEIDRAIGNVADGAFNFNEVGSMLNNWFTGASEANSMKYISNSKFGGNFAFNTIRYCTGITAGSSFMLNEVGEYFNNSSFGNNCYDNFFGPYCGSITAGNDFRQNTLELQCNNLTFGNNCTFNRMGTVSYSRIGNNCYSNQIDGGKYIFFGNASNQGGDWIAGNRFIGITQYVYFYNTNNAGQSNTLRKYHLFNICGTSESYKHVSDVTRNNSSEIFVLTRPGYSTPDANSLIYVNPAVLPEKTKGGTAGQILVKISGTDYDMGWRTVDVGSQIAYDSSNKTISLKDASGNVLGMPIDAADFIKDGMVSDVSVYNSNLVISFNTDAGKEDISIPLSHIFDSSNYYTKSEINDMFDDLDASLSETFSTISNVIEENELVTAAALTDLDTSISELKDNVESAFNDIYDDLGDMQSTVSGLETASPWIYGTGENSAVLRNGNLTAKGTNSISHGYGTKTVANYSHAEGENTVAVGYGSHTEGQGTSTTAYTFYLTGDASTSTYTINSTSFLFVGGIIEYETKFATILKINGSQVTLNRTLSSTALNNAKVIEHMGTASGQYSHAEGIHCNAGGTGSHAEGFRTYARSYSHAEGSTTMAKQEYSHAEGGGTMTFGYNSHAEGSTTVAYNNASHAEGVGSKTNASFTITGDANAIIYSTSASHNLKIGDIIAYDDVHSKVIRIDTPTNFRVDKTLSSTALSGASVTIIKGIAYGAVSHSEGWYNIAAGSGSHAEGYYTVADGSYAHAEGYYTATHYQASHAEGDHTVTDSLYSHAEGSYTKTVNLYEHAQGSYNMSHKVNTTFGNAGNTLSTIGIGTTNNNRKNAVEIMQNGDVYITGIGNYDGSNYIDASTLQEVVNNSGGGGSAITDLMTSVTYSELKALRDSSSLVPGMQYHIYDYVTTVGDASLSSAMHPFGIIVTANSPSELDENARICKVENDEYYTNLDAYEIKYCIDNDSSRFGWADPDGTGVIYYMKDDNRNEAYYDFTNILFDNKYTFDYNGTDARLNVSANIHDNVIGPHYGGYASAGSQQTYYALSPNNIVFEGLMNYSNTFGNDCYDMKFSNQTIFNIFDGAVWDCSFGTTTVYNHFGSYITGSIFPAKLATSDICSNILYVNVSGTTTPYIRCRIMPNIKGTSTSSRLSISITETGQHAGLNSSGVLKKWIPADLID